MNLGDLGEGRKQDKGSKDYLWSKLPPQLSNPAVTGETEGDRARITITTDVAVAESPQWKGKLRETLLVRPDGQIDVSWELKWEGADARTWELGLKVPLPAALNRMQWRREGVWTEYPPDHIGAARGTAAATDLTFRATKRDLHWLTMSAPGQGYALGLLSEGKTPLHSRGGLEKNGSLVLYANAASVVVVPSNDFAHGLLVDRVVHLRNGQTSQGAFSLRPTPAR